MKEVLLALWFLCVFSSTLQAQSIWNPKPPFQDFIDELEKSIPDDITVAEPGGSSSVHINWVCPAAALHFEEDLTQIGRLSSELELLLKDVLGVQTVCVDASAQEVESGWEFDIAGNLKCRAADVDFQCEYRPGTTSFECNIDGEPIPFTGDSSIDWNVFMDERGWSCDATLDNSIFCTPTSLISLGGSAGACGDWSRDGCTAYYYHANLGWQLFPCAADPQQCGYSSATCARFTYFTPVPPWPTIKCTGYVGGISTPYTQCTEAGVGLFLTR